MVSDRFNPEIATPGAESPKSQDHLSMAEFGNRLLLVLECFPSRRAASSIAGISVDQLHAYVKGRNVPPFLVVARLAMAARVSLDWLATGEGAMRPEPQENESTKTIGKPETLYDEALLIEIIQSSEEFLRKRPLKMRDSSVKARVIATLYRHACRRRTICAGVEQSQLRHLAESDLQAIEDLLRILR